MTALNRYTCEEAFRRLDDFLDRELAPEEMALVREHLEICDGCAREFRFEAGVLDNVRTRLRGVELPPDLATRIDAIISREREEGDSP